MADKYIPLFPNGFIHAQALGYIEKNSAANGNLCLMCGAVVGSRWLHDIYHGDEDDEEDSDG